MAHLHSCLASLMLLGISTSAEAQFEVCNETSHPARVALGHHDGAGWLSQGWWAIGPGECVLLLKSPLIARYYYLLAQHVGQGGGWDGDRYFCVQPQDFTVTGRTDCTSRSLFAAGFFEVDTGGETRWTQYLND